MLDETFVFLGNPNIGVAYRKTNESSRQYCKNSEIISFITESINNNTLNKGIKYLSKNAIKYKYKFNKGSNKNSVTVIIKASDYDLYETDIKTLNEELIENGIIKKYNLKKMKQMLNNSLVLLTYKNTVSINTQDII